jgi:hypothetical protein
MVASAYSMLRPKLHLPGNSTLCQSLHSGLAAVLGSTNKSTVRTISDSDSSVCGHTGRKDAGVPPSSLEIEAASCPKISIGQEEEGVLVGSEVGEKDVHSQTFLADMFPTALVLAQLALEALLHLPAELNPEGRFERNRKRCGARLCGRERPLGKEESEVLSFRLPVKTMYWCWQ